eukprot:SAG31_NODE_39500_length_287_cov_1.930851_2_plen_70_part_01
MREWHIEFSRVFHTARAPARIGPCGGHHELPPAFFRAPIGRVLGELPTPTAPNPGKLALIRGQGEWNIAS